MTTRRVSLLAGLSLALTRFPALGSSSDSAAVRYRAWLEQFKRDIARLHAYVGSEGSVSEDQVGGMCGASIAPHSRAALMVSEWIADERDNGNGRRRSTRYADLETVVLSLLELSIPAGLGGLFPEQHGSRFPSELFTVWYMHVRGPDALTSYFEDKSQFPQYALPPHGVLKRRAYPFILFEDSGNALRLAGIGAEWMGAAVHLYEKQYA